LENHFSMLTNGRRPSVTPFLTRLSETVSMMLRHGVGLGWMR
jgi:hypothetical protein